MISGARAVLLGWGNSTPSQLMAYERLYRLFGLTASSIIPNTLHGLARSKAYARTLAPLAAELAAEGGARPIIVQLFSDNGFIGWAALLDALAATDGGRRARAAMCGVVIDSAPGLWATRGTLDFARRFSLGMTPAISRLAKLGARERLPIVTPLLAAGFVGYQMVFRSSVKVLLSASDRVEANQPRCSHLFMYGEEDILVPPRDIRAWIARQRDAGIDVEEHAFANARHVALFPKDPRRYKATLGAFVTRVITAASPPLP